MPVINLVVDGDGCWDDLPELIRSGRLINLMGEDAPAIQLAALPGGMQSGAVSVTFRFNLPDGKTLITETSLNALWAAVNAIAVHYGIIK